MARAELSVAAYRRATMLVTLLSVGALTAAIYFVLPGHGDRWLALPLGVAAVAAMWAATKLGVRGEAAAERTLVLVEKRDCLLCEEAKARLGPLAAQYGFSVTKVLIEDSAALAARYRDWVPVILWKEQELGKGRIDWVSVEAHLAATRRPPGG